MNSSWFSLESYDCIGFDLDCTIAEYNVKNLCKLVYDLLVKYLIKEKHYAREFFTQSFEELEYFLQKGLFMDLKKGNVLKINAKGGIVMATHGTRILSEQQILEQYGTNKTVDAFTDFLQDPLSFIYNSKEKILRPALDCFSMPCTVLFAQVVNHLDERERDGGPSGEYKIGPDLLSGLYHLYGRKHFASGESEFFRELRNNPCLYYRKWNPDKLNWLKELKSKKFLFLLTGSFIDFASITASHCLGENWKEYFDIIICYARKPFFFSPGHPYFRVEKDKEIQLEQGEHLEMSTVYSQGNWQQLKAFISKHIKLEEPKCLYIGDNLIEDVYSPDNFQCCDSVAVLFELRDEFKSSDIWNSYFEGSNSETSYWNHLVKRHAKISVSGLDVFVKRAINFQYHVLGSAKTNSIDEVNGYYAD